MALTFVPLATPAGAAASRPNIVVVLTDDQAWSTFDRTLMPAVFSELVDRGILFRRGYVNTPICCPSRAQLLTGQWAHHNRVFFNETVLTRKTIVRALDDAGYRTMLAGKYLNSHPCTPLPEFDRWVCSGEGRSDYSLIDPLLNVDGTWKRFTGYATDLLATRVRSFISNTPPGTPFFVLFSPTSPHLPADDDRYASMPVTPFRPPSYNEPMKGSGKPKYMRRGPLTVGERAAIDGWYAAMSRSVRALDDSISRLLDGLGDRADDTIVFYLSDNGWMYGEHRRWDKGVPYEESVRVPFVVRYPRLTGGGTVSRALVGNVDVAATIADLAAVSLAVDGKSLVPLLNGTSGRVRRAFLLEHCLGLASVCPGGGLVFGQRQPPGYWGLVTARYKLVLYGTGARELYDLWQDPYELSNVAGDPGRAGLLNALIKKLNWLRSLPPS
ncbi:MAG: sulfatase-like hydrolase/transferase [Actinobacteria bacterium]|nr:sulfatase-like hydrolase/transferase [Actinomycetota bacterium]